MTDIELAAKVRQICETDDNFLASVRVQYDRMAFVDSEATYGVFVQTTEDGYVTAIDSDAFITDLSFWFKVDEGRGELYKYARVNYCPKGLTTDGGYNYKLVDGVVVYAPQQEQPEDHNEMASQEQFFIASRKYLPGELISIQGRMYEVVSIILPEGKITPNTNVRELTLEQYINKKIEEATS